MTRFVTQMLNLVLLKFVYLVQINSELCSQFLRSRQSRFDGGNDIFSADRHYWFDVEASEKLSWLLHGEITTKIDHIIGFQEKRFFRRKFAKSLKTVENRRKQLKITENSRKSQKTFENHWKQSKIAENSRKLSKTVKNCRKKSKIAKNSKNRR
jgi:hypothetical protein